MTLSKKSWNICLLQSQSRYEAKNVAIWRKNAVTGDLISKGVSSMIRSHASKSQLLLGTTKGVWPSRPPAYALGDSIVFLKVKVKQLATAGNPVKGNYNVFLRKNPWNFFLYIISIDLIFKHTDTGAVTDLFTWEIYFTVPVIEIWTNRQINSIVRTAGPRLRSIVPFLQCD